MMPHRPGGAGSTGGRIAQASLNTPHAALVQAAPKAQQEMVLANAKAAVGVAKTKAAQDKAQKKTKKQALLREQNAAAAAAAKVAKKAKYNARKAAEAQARKVAQVRKAAELANKAKEKRDRVRARAKAKEALSGQANQPSKKKRKTA
jgi:colicin import membrane protein